MWDLQVPSQGSNLGPLQWKHRDLTTGSLGLFPACFVFKKGDEESLCGVNKFGKCRKRPRVCGREGVKMEDHAY